jgi:hypothetical protein
MTAATCPSHDLLPLAAAQRYGPLKQPDGRTSCDHGTRKMTDLVSVEHPRLSEVAIDDALRRAAVSARQQYVRAGLSMPVWRGGRVVWLKSGDVVRFCADNDAGSDCSSDLDDSDDATGAEPCCEARTRHAVSSLKFRRGRSDSRKRDVVPVLSVSCAVYQPHLSMRGAVNGLSSRRCCEGLNHSCRKGNWSG